EQRAAALAAQFPGVGLEPQGGRVRVTIPDVYRVGHEAHFAQVANRFFEYLRNPASFPAWENPGMLAKYSVSTRGVALSHAAGA
ncbi:MAG TPA: putative oxidoreductase C-terminal domain-containing protein, partial [Candidatus Saccharimonadales bacterium]|nr:putative oxidoreductase C-terminal domain-containing protein [Candidatus Saccharimonadales bacterium]